MSDSDCQSVILAEQLELQRQDDEWFVENFERLFDTCVQNHNPDSVAAFMITCDRIFGK